KTTKTTIFTDINGNTSQQTFTSESINETNINTNIPTSYYTGMFDDIYQTNSDKHILQLQDFIAEHIFKPLGFVMLYGIIIAWYGFWICFALSAIYFCFFCG
ncbi:MAG: hypothetical protein LBJ00_04305, partial [Planctomycetaceae bacterium]|nr:hypothetical protein [Planctomycetaceae bacterium]